MHLKQGLVDLKCKDKAGNIFIVEMQNDHERHLLKRMQFYAASAYTGQLERGMAYKDLFPVFIILGSQIISPAIPLVSCHKIQEKNSGKSIFNDISYISVELEKFTKRASENEFFRGLAVWVAVNTIVNNVLFKVKIRSLEIAKNMLCNLHVEMAIVQKATGLSREVLTRLKLRR